MRILVVSKSTGQGTGASEATHYVARRKDEPEHTSEHAVERAGEAATNTATRLFSATADSLGHRRANLVLGAGQVPATRDVMHLVISFAQEEDFLALGPAEPARQAAVRDLTRATLAAVRAELGARDLRWVAGLHRNTAHPHVHLLLPRAYVERESGATKRLQTLPAALRVSWEKAANGERQIHPGGLAQTFERLLAERLARAAQQRGENEMARLAAQQLLAAARLQTEREAAAKFAAMRHLLHWEISAGKAGDAAPLTTTLAATERALRWESDQAQFIGERQVHWHDERRAAARLRVTELSAQRAAVLKQIAARQAQYDERLAAQQTLADAHAKAAKSLQSIGQFIGQSTGPSTGQLLPPPQFTAAELQELDQLAARRSDPAFYRALLEWERAFDAQPFPSQSHPLPARTSRARARSLLAEITEREALQRWQSYQTRRAQTDVLLPATHTDQLTTARLADVQPRSRLARAFPSFTTNSELYQTVATALAQHEQRLASELTRATATRRVLTDAANEYVTQFRQAYPAAQLPAPHFIPDEQQRIAAALARESDPALRARFAAYLREERLDERTGGRTDPRPAPEFVYDSLTEVLRAYTTPTTVRADDAEHEHGFER